MKYWVHNGSDSIGPFDVDEIRSHVPGFGPETLVSPENATSPDAWRPAKTVAGILFKPPPPPLTPVGQIEEPDLDDPVRYRWHVKFQIGHARPASFTMDKTGAEAIARKKDYEKKGYRILEMTKTAVPNTFEV